MRGSVISVTLSGLGRAAKASSALAAFEAGLARRDAQVDEAPIAEEAEARIRRQERVPAEVLFDDEDFPILDARAPGRRTNRISGFEREQRLVAVHDVQRGERAPEVGRQVVGPEIHAGGRTDWSRRTICCTASDCISRNRRCSWISRASRSLSS